MSGLLIKDFRLLLQRKQSMVLLLVLAVALNWTMGESNSFIMGYLPLISLIFATGTISYDEFDNGYPFLLTLPITRRQYVLEKYLLCFVTGLIGVVLAGVIGVICSVVRGNAVDGMLALTIPFLAVSCMLMDLMIPVMLKYGAEKSRIVLIVIMGVVGVVVYSIGKLNHILQLDMEGLVERMDNVSDFVVTIVMIALTGVLTIVSVLISDKVMENKCE